MKKIDKYILEKLHIDKDTEDSFNHMTEDFPINCIGVEGECYTINHEDYNWRMINFRSGLMDITKKTKYKDIVFTVKDKDDIYYLKFLGIHKPRGRAAEIRFTNFNHEFEKFNNGYGFIQSKLMGASLLNGGISIEIVNKNYSAYRATNIKYIHMSWSDKLKAICINFELF